MNSENEEALQGTITVANSKYYYRLIYCHDGIIFWRVLWMIRMRHNLEIH